MPQPDLLITSDTSIPYTVEWVRKVAVEGTKNKDLQKIALECKNSGDPLKCVFDKVYDIILYSPCPENEQSLRTIENMLREGKGNCVNYSTMIASILMLMNVPFFFRTVAYSNPFKYDHIYIVTKSGIVLDPVQGQIQDGSETRQNRPVQGMYNQEVTYKFKKDFDMSKLSLLQGTIKTPTDKLGYPLGFERSRILRQARYGVMNRADCGCDDCQQKTLGTWLSSAVRFVGEIASAPFVTTVNAVSNITTGKNALNIKYSTGITGAIADGHSLFYASPITAYDTITGKDVGLTYNTKLAADFVQAERKAQYQFVNIIGGIFGVQAHDSSKPKASAINSGITLPETTIPRSGITSAGMGGIAIAVMAMIALGSMKTKPNKKTK